MVPKGYFTYLIVSFFVICSGCASLRPKARLTGVCFGELRRGALELVFDVEVKNPYPVRLPVTSVDYSLTSGEIEFIAGNSEANAVIPAGSKEEFALPVRVDYGNILRALKGIRPGSTIPYKAELALAVDTQTFGAIDLPLKKQGEIKLPTISGDTLKKVWELIRRE